MTRRFAAVRRAWQCLTGGATEASGLNVQGVILATKRYVRGELSEHFGISNQAPTRIELPIKGKRNLLWLVTLADEKYVLHCFLPDQKQRMDRHVKALRLMEEHGVCAPRLVHTVQDVGKYGMYFATTGFVEGEGRGGDQQLSMDEVKCLAVQAGRLHSISNERWGSLTNVSSEDYSAEHVNQAGRYLEKARQYGLTNRDQYGHLSEWFYSWELHFQGIKRFSLVHGDMHPNNVLFRDGQECCLVDTDQFSWNLGMMDIAMIHDRACRGDAERIKVFDATYLALLDDKARELHERLYPFFAAYYRLGAVVRAMRQKERNPDAATPRVLKKDTWQEMLDICISKA